MNKNIQNIVSGLVLVAALSIVGVVIYNDRTPPEERLMEGDTTSALIAVPGGGAIEAEFVEPSNSLVSPSEIPDLDRAIVFPEGMPSSVKEDTARRLEETILFLKANPNGFAEWISLGLYRKLIEDYDGAREAWEYASILQATNSLPLINVADLYAYYLKDNKKAEENFLLAIEVDPFTEIMYLKTYEFYRYILKDSVKARSILEEGVKANPSSSTLKGSLQEFNTSI